VGKKLEELFIYSFVKALYNGIYCDKISNSADFGLFLEGHGLMYHILKNNMVNSNKEGISFFSTIDLGTSQEKRALILKLLLEFPFLAKSLRNINAFGNKQFVSPEHESYLNALEEDHYCKNHTQQGERKTHSDYPNGKLCLLRVKASDENNITSFQNTPLLNAFANSDESKLHCILPRGKNIVPNNASFFFSMAIFVVAKDSQRDRKKISRVYNEIELNDNTIHLACSQVHAITGINCVTVDVPRDSVSPIKIPSFEEIREYFYGLADEKFDEIFERIADGLKDVDLETIIEEILPKSKKKERKS
jgi:hypothetical protein